MKLIQMDVLFSVSSQLDMKGKYFNSRGEVLRACSNEMIRCRLPGIHAFAWKVSWDIDAIEHVHFFINSLKSILTYSISWLSSTIFPFFLQKLSNHLTCIAVFVNCHLISCITILVYFSNYNECPKHSRIGHEMNGFYYLCLCKYLCEICLNGRSYLQNSRTMPKNPINTICIFFLNYLAICVSHISWINQMGEKTLTDFRCEKWWYEFIGSVQWTI